MIDLISSVALGIIVFLMIVLLAIVVISLIPLVFDDIDEIVDWWEKRIRSQKERGDVLNDKTRSDKNTPR